MAVINTNVKAQFAANSLSVNNRTLTNAMQQLSTGKRINAAKDDAAGLAISTRMTADLRGMSMAVKNANDGISMMQTAEGALGEVNNMLQRMRELSVQASTGSMTADNRKALQKEMNQLISEIDNVAKKTNFNGINLLDGTAKGVKIQTNVKEGDQVSVDVASATSKSLGLQGFRVEGQMTSGRVGAISTQIDAEDDVLINGKAAFADVATLDDADAALNLAKAINENVGEHRVTAAAFNTLKGVAPTASVFDDDDLTINGSAVSAASSVEELVSNINRDVAGVRAVLSSDGTIELSNDTGQDIEIGGTDSMKAGFDSDGGEDGAGTYSGYVTLTSMDGNPISIKAKSEANGYQMVEPDALPTQGAGTIEDVKSMGFNETIDGEGFTGAAVSGDRVAADGLTTITGAITLDDDVRINGVRVGVTTDGSAMAKASAINAISGETGVTASAKTEMVLNYDHSASMSGATIIVNGKEIALTNVTDLNDVVDTINSFEPGVVASTFGDGKLLLTATTGADISVANKTGTWLEAPETTTNDNSVSDSYTGAGTDVDPWVTKGRITLSSDTGADIRIESFSTFEDANGDTQNASALLGMSDQGGSDTLVGGALSITTQEAAGRAITSIDKAIDSVAMERANLGAFQNRLTAAVDNLNSTMTNLSESRSRILDADYAAVTTELARSQIVQQAATAMLAQANQQPQTVLALLQ
jgi:flagellin